MVALRLQPVEPRNKEAEGAPHGGPPPTGTGGVSPRLSLSRGTGPLSGSLLVWRWARGQSKTPARELDQGFNIAACLLTMSQPHPRRLLETLPRAGGLALPRGIEGLQLRDSAGLRPASHSSCPLGKATP